MRVRGLALALLLSLAGGSSAGAADLRETEVVGAVPLREDARPTTPPHEAAVTRALSEAVRRVALELVADPSDPQLDRKLSAALGNEPRAYVSRFRTLEDRGVRPALFSEDPEARTEYVVMVTASVDADRVRDRLERAGLATPAGEVERHRVRVEAEGCEDFAAYRALRETLLTGVGVRSALPVELSRGHAVLDVDGELAGDALFEALRRAAPPRLTLTQLEVEAERLRLRVEWAPEPAGAPVAAPGGAAD
jgi:hypothetical protein